jgi:hypothetical protein
MIDPANVLVGSLLSFAISQLKRIPLVKRNPKVVTAILSTALPAGLVIYETFTGQDMKSIQHIAAQAATIFAGAIATHEAVTHPLKELG